ncbi:unnamed protein product [Allacma fusca]|uniref:EF-hand domain-containing protein n=3 Tax=Allacma fusca TaxID=39272 RepID=A0A8J2MA65_9HEXA|nr:unnamed protein product [Allacma fusca]
MWLSDENVGQEIMIEHLTSSFEDSELKKKEEEEEEGKPDPLTQLVTTFCRGAMTERSGALQEDPLYMSYAEVMGKSCGEEEEEGGEEEGGEGEEGGASIHRTWEKLKEQEMEKQKLLFHQARLSNRGVAEMVLLHISACKGVPSDMFFRKEETNFISAHEIDNMALIMPTASRRTVVADPTAQTGGKIKKKKHRDKKRDKDKELASSLMVACLKRLLPVGLNLFAGREQELVQHCKDRYLKKLPEQEIIEFAKTQLTLPDKIDPSDSMSWQHHLYSKLGSKKPTADENDPNNKTTANLTKQQILDELVGRITAMAKVLFGLHMIDHPQQQQKGAYRSVVSGGRKKAVIACFRQTSIHATPRHRAINLFLRSYREMWLSDENVGQEIMIEHLTVMKTLELGISTLRGGNVDVQMGMLNHLKEKKDVGFFTSIAGLMNSCSVLDLDAFERNTKAEGLGVGSEGAAGEKNMHDAEFTCALFRFIQLTCEGHNLEWQNYLRTQAGNTTTVNVVICTVDYLLRLQESIMDFYWHYSSKELIDPAGKANFFKAIGVASQVFNTLTEVIQGPCTQNQQALAHSRLWDAVGGFLFLFAHMQAKLSKNSSQVDLLKELLNLQKDMVIMMLSMLEGNVVNGTIGKQMVDTLVESASNVEIILRYFDMFLKLKDLTSSTTFQEMDINKDGWITPKEFREKMEQFKNYTAEEINFLLMCCDTNHDGKIDYIEFTERFHNPAKDIGFNLAVLLTNLSEHMPNEPRLARFLETAGSVLNYFEAFLGRIEIMGGSHRIERVYFEIKESNIEQWEKPQIKESKRAFFYSIVTEGGDKEKLEAFVNFCEDAIFEMQHASALMATEEEGCGGKAREAAYKLPTDEEEEKPSLTWAERGTLVKQSLTSFKDSVRAVLSAVSPANIKRKIRELQQMSIAELFFGFVKLIFYSLYYTGFSIGGILKYLGTSLLNLMRGPPPEKAQEETTAEDYSLTPMIIPPLPPSTGPPEEVTAESGQLVLFGAEMPSEEGAATAGADGSGSPHLSGTEGSGAETSGEEGDGNMVIARKSEGPEGSTSPTTEKPVQTLAVQSDVAAQQQAVMAALSKAKAEEAADDIPAVSQINFGDYANRIISFLARNFYNLKYVALILAFIINFMLLFFKATALSDGIEGDDEEGSGFGMDGSGYSAEDMDGGSGSGNGTLIEDEEEEDALEFVHIDEKYFYMGHLIRILSIIHSIVSLAMLIAYYHLKVPLAIFKREKEIARKLEFDGLYIAEQPPEDNDLNCQWDKLVISAKCFPVNYWDKFIKKKVRQKYSETYDFDHISNLLGMEKTSFSVQEETTEGGIINFITAIDWRYQVWKAGVTITDNAFLYSLLYFIFSILGNFNFFFFAAHLLDIAVAVPALKTILQSVTHNGKQLVLTVMLLTIVVYIYTVVAFNFFRKFYIQEEDDQVDQKCHDMLTCFVFHLYKGVRAGGGIGDEIESPDGDPFEVYRIIFDITFFFFVIVILLAIIQGLIIDAFGELRDQLNSVSETLESECFICGIGKDYFDIVPHGFETHVLKEHNLANYMFFLMHLINKPDTEYTGQETYVWNMYQQRCWDFFPVGECFRKQYEAELSGKEG